MPTRQTNRKKVKIEVKRAKAKRKIAFKERSELNPDLLFASRSILPILNDLIEEEKEAKKPDQEMVDYCKNNGLDRFQDTFFQTHKCVFENHQIESSNYYAEPMQKRCRSCANKTQYLLKLKRRGKNYDTDPEDFYNLMLDLCHECLIVGIRRCADFNFCGQFLSFDEFTKNKKLNDEKRYCNDCM